MLGPIILICIYLFVYLLPPPALAKADYMFFRLKFVAVRRVVRRFNWLHHVLE